MHLTNREYVTVLSRREWREWLINHYRQTEGIWLITYKKGFQPEGTDYVSYDDVVEEALCFGWIDSLPRKLDEERKMLYISPRKKGSNWSIVNKQRIEKLAAAGLMTEAGTAKILEAQATGTWDILEDVHALVIPDDLQKSLSEHPPAETHFNAFPPSVKRGILEWIKNAKRPETRAERIRKTSELAKQNIRVNFA